MAPSTLRKRPAAAKGSQAKRVCADDWSLGKGSFADMFVKHIFKVLQGMGKDKTLGKNVPKPVRLATACSGSGVAEMAHRSLMQHLGHPTLLDYSCENDARKQRFIVSVVHPFTSTSPSGSGGGSPCCFDDICYLAQGMASCCVHSGRCEVKSGSHIFVTGFSCKDFSKLSNKVLATARANILREVVGSSGTTFAGVVGVASTRRPRIILLENVDNIIKSGADETLWDCFASLSYFGEVRVLNSMEFGIPQNRSRAFFLLLDANFFGLDQTATEGLAAQILKDIDLFQMKTLKLGSFLLNSSNLYLQGELQKRIDHPPSEAGSADVEWPRFHRGFLERKGLTRALVVPPPAVRTSRWFSTLNPRAQEALGFGLRHGSEKNLNLCSIDIGPSINMITFGKEGMLPTVVPRNITWLVSKNERWNNRLMLGYEALALQGFPVQDILHQKEFEPSDNLLNDLGGNAFCLPIVMAIFAAIYLNVDTSKFDLTSAATAASTSDLLNLLSD